MEYLLCRDIHALPFNIHSVSQKLLQLFLLILLLSFIIVVLRSYIAGLRDQLKEYKVRAENADDDPHAHYHGHERCTSGKMRESLCLYRCLVYFE